MRRGKRLKQKTAKQTITVTEYNKIIDEAEKARQFLESADYQFIRDYLENTKKYVLEVHAKQSIEDVQVSVNIGDKINQQIKKFFKPAQKEYDKLAGKYLFVEEFISFVKGIAELEKLAKDDIDTGVLEVVKS